MGTAKALREGTYRSRRGDSTYLLVVMASEVGASLATSPEELSPLLYWVPEARSWTGNVSGRGLRAPLRRHGLACGAPLSKKDVICKKEA